MPGPAANRCARSPRIRPTPQRYWSICGRPRHRGRTSAGAAIAVDLAVRRPDLVRVVLAHEFPWRFTRHLPAVSQVAALAKIGSLALRGRQSDAAEALLRAAYTYRDGGPHGRLSRGVAAGRQGKRQGSLGGLPNSTGTYPSRADLATVKVPVVCTYGARAPTAWSAWSDRLPLPSPLRGHNKSKGPATGPLRCNNQLRAADRRQRDLLRQSTASGCPRAMELDGRPLEA